MTHSGGCQCGAVRFRIEDGGLGHASICHCRMCQKAFGGFFGPLVAVHNDKLAWTRGAPAYFQSSNLVRRGFCAQCGTPLTYVYAAETTEIAIGALDHPEAAPPVAQLQIEHRLSFVPDLANLPVKPEFVLGDLVPYQHPDHDMADWPPKSGA